MSLLASDAHLRARIVVARGPLASLAAGLHRELEPLLRATPDVPRDKALLSRAGGRCDRDGSYLVYHPFDARHRCARCGRELSGEAHDRFRLYWHQLWLAERTVHAALLGVVLDDAACRALATELLDAYAAQYLRYPNRDNVLGPSRPFFSTYLESIWLLQLCIALDLLESASTSADVRALGGRVRDELVAPSASLIASFDEGMSNRQVWHNAALFAAARVLGDAAMADRAVEGPSGLIAHLSTSLLADGSWYEGENYHLFAHRGLWYGVQMAERAGRPLGTALTSRLRDGFAAPFRTLLPDLTYPARRDSQYAVSVRQPRFAESCELGLARGDDERLVAMLARLYDPSVPRGDTGRAASSADVERNLPGTGLTRADLSWRSLLLARGELPPLEMHALESDLLPAQGIGVLRREGGRLFAALDYGSSGGGHGHPDRLNLLLADGDTRWFDDPGTGSYVDPTLHWYRSTLAHTAPLIDGRSQPRVNGRLLAFDDGGAAGWVRAEAELAPGLCVTRSVVLCEDYLVDELAWESDAEHEVALPLHGVELVSAGDATLPRTAAPLSGENGLADGFDFLSETARVDTNGQGVALLRAVSGDRVLRGWVFADATTSWWSAMAPGVPGTVARVPLVLARHRARAGRIVSVWSWRGAVRGVDVERARVLVRRASSETDLDAHTPDERSWRIERERGTSGRPSIVELRGAVDHPLIPRDDAHQRGDVSSARVHRLPFAEQLGENHYRRSEESWREAGMPRASVSLRLVRPATLAVDVDIAPSARRFVAIDADNPFDNEPMAINGDGIQLYVDAGEQRAGWLLVPREGTHEVDCRPAAEWPTDLAPRAHWRATSDGWALTAEVELPAAVREVALDLVINETTLGRDRRRGQLVLSGARGEFVYLRGDRHERDRLLRFTLPDV